MTIRAISFDMWDTLVDDDSDEKIRAERGLPSKREERRHLVWRALNEIEPTDYERVALAYDTADAGFNLVWKKLHINWTLEQRLRVVLDGLGRTLPADAYQNLVDETARMEVEIPPNPIDGVALSLEALSRDYKLCVVSDSIVTPGTGLRQILDGHGLKQYFSAFAFSDEVGRSKPHSSMFDTAADALGVERHEIIHVGDRDQNDVKGPHAIGARAVLFTATRPDDADITTADAICASHQDLPGVIARVVQKAEAEGAAA
ncbi:MAG: HAD family hydrolase [Hyphomicrobiaceae bacterium]|nr:HAD family hydrolase [Hyphomicrobiaceae bacterium]